MKVSKSLSRPSTQSSGVVGRGVGVGVAGGVGTGVGLGVRGGGGRTVGAGVVGGGGGGGGPGDSVRGANVGTWPA
jgi:hypothetical protein